MMKVLLIFVGAGFGGVLRYALGGWVQGLSGGTFPVGTLTVNVLGCFAIGFLGAFYSGSYMIREEYRLAVLVGLLGGFTTFSTFGYETFQLASDGGGWLRAGLNLVLSNGFGLTAIFIGTRLAERFYGV